MDTLDIRIFRELVQDKTGSAFVSDPRWSYRKIAKSLHVDQGTVRSRVRRMEECGFLKGWKVFLNPRIRGMKVAQVWFDVFSRSGKEDLIRKLGLVDGIVVIVNHLGDSIYFAMVYDNEDSFRRRLELVQRLANPQNLFHSELWLPPSQVLLSESDFEVVQQVQANPRGSYAEIAGKLGFSTRTVKRRLARMIEGKAVFVLPSMDPAALQGALVADLLVTYSDLGQKAKLDAEVATRFEAFLARAEVINQEVSFFNLFLGNISQAQGIMDWVKNKPGVATAKMDLVQSRLEVYDSLGQNPNREQIREPLRRFA